MDVAILIGSESDMPVMDKCAEILTSFGVSHELYVASAHRSPERVRAVIEKAEQKGAKIFIAAAGLAAHLAGAVAAHTEKPVIGVPIEAGPLKGMDALLSTVQMPGGVPVATVAIGSSGAKNSAYLAIRILALSDEKLAEKQSKFIKEQAAPSG